MVKGVGDWGVGRREGRDAEGVSLWHVVGWPLHVIPLSVGLGMRIRQLRHLSPINLTTAGICKLDIPHLSLSGMAIVCCFLVNKFSVFTAPTSKGLQHSSGDVQACWPWLVVLPWLPGTSC